MGIEHQCVNCALADHYKTGDNVTVEKGQKLKASKEFYARRCIPTLVLFWRRCITKTDSQLVALPGEDDCITGKFVPIESKTNLTP